MRAWLLSESRQTGNRPKICFLPSDRQQFLEFLLSNNDITWSIDEIEIYESPDSTSLAEREERKKQLKSKGLAEPLSR